MPGVFPKDGKAENAKLFTLILFGLHNRNATGGKFLASLSGLQRKERSKLLFLFDAFFK